MADFRKLRTVSQIAAESDGTFTAASLRWMVFQSEANGLDKAIVRLGRRVYFDIDRFNEWLATHYARG